jgi:5-dehydro-2-deoxygluconokinase
MAARPFFCFKSPAMAQSHNPSPNLSQDLFIMPFDHRGSFEQKMFGIKGRPPTPQETTEISAYKRIIYDGFLKAVADGVSKDKTGILVDEQFGSEILKDAKAQGFKTAVTAEKSGQDEFDFEYGQEFGAHINKFSPTFVKVLVRYNPEGDAAMNHRQTERLKRLSDYCKTHDSGLMFELLVVATQDQLVRAGGDHARYDREIRPALMVKAMKEIQDAGIEPTLWKVEGIETEENGKALVDQARRGGRTHVGLIILGRGESEQKVRHWLATAAHVPGFVGFAVGRTIFWDPLKNYREGKFTREQAVAQVAQNYRACCELWEKERQAKTASPSPSRSLGLGL